MNHQKFKEVSSHTIAALSLLFLVTISGCAVGPDFHAPQSPDTNEYTATPLSAETVTAPGPSGVSQRLLTGRDIPAEWWTLFRSPELDSIVKEALKNNPSLAASEATIRQAQELLNATVGSALLPRVDANASIVRQKISGAFIGQPNLNIHPFTLYNASVNVSYALDIWGGARRQLESLRAQVDYQRFQLEAAYLTISANIVTTAIREASIRAQLQATRDIIDAQQNQLDLVEKQYKLGGAAYSDVLAQKTQLAQTRAILPSLEKELSQTRHALAVLSGKLPSQGNTIPEFKLDSLSLPQELPVSVPSSLVRQRPDIRASEEHLHSANAQIGVATALLLPQVTITGAAGYQSPDFASLFHPSTAVWNIGAGLLQPIFRGGELTAKRRAAIAAYEAATASYKSTALQAFQNVADVLRALELDADALKARAEAEAAAKDSLDLAQKQFDLGAISYLSLLNAVQQYQQARISLIQAQAARFADTAALFQALGGGWWNRADKAESASDKTK